MSMLAVESDKHLAMVGPEGALMMKTLNHTTSQGTESKQNLPRASVRHGNTAADQMMYAWSMGAIRSANAGSSMVRSSKREDCPPEVYLG